MIEIVFVACLGIAPATCERHALQFADVTLMACVTGAQPQLARWAGEHPGWRIQSWSCRQASLDRNA